jgi:hypothetical protein
MKGLVEGNISVFVPGKWIYLWLYSPCESWPLFSFFILHAVVRTPWTGDQPIGRSRPIHRTTQTQNKCKQTSMPRVGFEPTIPVFERAKTVHASDRAPTVVGKELPTARGVPKRSPIQVGQGKASRTISQPNLEPGIYGRRCRNTYRGCIYDFKIYAKKLYGISGTMPNPMKNNRRQYEASFRIQLFRL